jgi:hypothetical protein
MQRVEADQVGQLKRPLRMRAAEPHAGVDALGRGVPGLQHPDGGQQVGHQQRVDHETRPVGRADRCLAEHAGDEGVGAFCHVLAGKDRRDHLDQLLHRRGVEEVQADHLRGPAGGAGDLDDRDG